MQRYFPSGTQLIQPATNRRLTEAKPGQPPKIAETSLVDSDDFLKNCEYCLFYHSANWCAPCRTLCKILVERYQTLKNLHGDKVEIVMVSSDAEEPEYDKSLVTATWSAIPYDNETLRGELPALLGVEDIPTVVVVRCSDGKIINGDAVSSIAADADCKNYPWKPHTFQDVMANAIFVNRDKKPDQQINYADLVKNKKAIAVYFSAAWCLPCSGFTELLGSIHRKLRDRDPTALEVCVVPGDRDKKVYDSYLAACPFVSLPFNDPRISILNQMFSIQSIPTLIIIDAQTGDIINPSAREDVSCDPDGQDCPWVPKPAPLISSFEPTNSCVEIFVNNPCVLLNLFDVNAERANLVLAQYREAAALFRAQEGENFEVRFLVTKNKQEMDHADHTTCLKSHKLAVSEKPMDCTCDICNEPIQDDDDENIDNHMCCSSCGYDVCGNCWAAKRAGQPKDAAFWHALSGDLGMNLDEEISAEHKKVGVPYVTKFSLKDGKSRILKPIGVFDKGILLEFFAYDL